MSTVVENRQGAVSRAASNRCMYKCMMYVYVCQLINFHISTNMHSFIIINRRSFARWNCRPCAVTLQADAALRVGVRLEDHNQTSNDHVLF